MAIPRLRCSSDSLPVSSILSSTSAMASSSETGSYLPKGECPSLSSSLPLSLSPFFALKTAECEGRLAQAAVHRTTLIGPLFSFERYERFISPHLPSGNGHSDTDDHSTPADQWSTITTTNSARVEIGLTALEIYSLFMTDTGSAPLPYDSERGVDDTLEQSLLDGRAEALLKLADKWSLTDQELRDGPGGYEVKVGELGVLCTLLACGSSRWGKKPRVEFFAVSCISCIFS